MSRRKLYVIAGVAAAAALAGGGAALATSGGGDDQTLGGAAADKARAAAVAHVGGGKAGEVEHPGDGGAAYEVEVRSADGSVRDVSLDSGFKPIAAAADSDRHDGGRDD